MGILAVLFGKREDVFGHTQAKSPTIDSPAKKGKGTLYDVSGLFSNKYWLGSQGNYVRAPARLQT